jgi:uncharacterized lipoprotein YajG
MNRLAILMNRLAILMCVLALAGCSKRSAIEDVVRENLIDPDSAQFGEIVEYTGRDGDAEACVMVNSKNRMGGYTGESVVVVQKDADGNWEFQRQGVEGWDCAKHIEVQTADQPS